MKHSDALEIAIEHATNGILGSDRLHVWAIQEYGLIYLTVRERAKIMARTVCAFTGEDKAIAEAIRWVESVMQEPWFIEFRVRELA